MKEEPIPNMVLRHINDEIVTWIDSRRVLSAIKKISGQEGTDELEPIGQRILEELKLK